MSPGPETPQEEEEEEPAEEGIATPRYLTMHRVLCTPTPRTPGVSVLLTQGTGQVVEAEAILVVVAEEEAVDAEEEVLSVMVARVAMTIVTVVTIIQMKAITIITQDSINLQGPDRVM